MTKQQDRQKALDVTKTIFGLATGRIRHDKGEQFAAANGLAVFQQLPALMLQGYFSRPDKDFTERADFKFLMGHLVDDDVDLLQYVRGLDKHVMEQMADFAETLFIDIVKADGIINMDAKSKREVLQTMARA